MKFLTSRINKYDGSLSSSGRCEMSGFNLSSRSYESSVSNIRHAKTCEVIDYCLSDNVSCVNISETHHWIPPLDIKSEENYPTTRGNTFSYRHHCKEKNSALKRDEAFETWLSAKRKVLSDQAAKRKKEEEIKKRCMEERQRLAKEKYDMWLQKKSKISITQQSNSKYIKSDDNLEIRKRGNFSHEECQARLEKWKTEKRIKEEERRIFKRIEDEHRLKMKEERRVMAAEAWKNWVANANKKPKPVPLNRGIFTLRGTISDIFLNPNEWEPIHQKTQNNNLKKNTLFNNSSL